MGNRSTLVANGRLTRSRLGSPSVSTANSPLRRYAGLILTGVATEPNFRIARNYRPELTQRPSGLKRYGAQLLQPRAFRFGLLEDGDVGVGIFPEVEEVLVGGAEALAVSPEIAYARAAPRRASVPNASPVVIPRWSTIFMQKRAYLTPLLGSQFPCSLRTITISPM